VLVLRDPRFGALVRQLRESRGLTRDAVAVRVLCDPSLVSQVETGRRVLKPWLAQRLDNIYGTGTTIAGLASSLAHPDASGCATLGGDDDFVRVELPHGGGTMIVPRRAVLAALSIGTTASTLTDLRQALGKVPAGEELLAEQAQTLLALQIAGRVMPPARLIESLIGQVAILDVMRDRAPATLRRNFSVLQAQYADYLSWMVQESGDLHGAASWVDRMQHWATRAGWPTMAAYAHVRRSVLANTCASDGRAAVEHAHHALHVAGASQQVRGLAAKQMAYGHALTGHVDACHRALDLAADLHATATAEDENSDPIIGPISLGPSGKTLDISVMLAEFRATCDVSLGGGEDAIAALSTYRTAYGPKTRRGAFTGARISRAYAQAGYPTQACTLALEALDTGQALDSATTRVELRRALGPLRRWPERSDVAEVRHRITALG
jgi:hypothetical protein